MPASSPNLLRPASALFLLLVTLTACETAPEAPPPVDDPARAWAERQETLDALHNWMAVGKLAVRSADEAWNAGVQWEQITDSFRIRLTGPLGQGLMQLEGDPGRVELRTAEGEIMKAADPDALIHQETGWRVPVAGLRYWILGRPAPHDLVDDYTLDAGGRLAELQQSGWHIRYDSYREFDGVALPTKLSFENPRLAAKLIVRSWTLGPDST